MQPFVALLRGINVGKAKRVPMAALRELMEGLGYGRVATLLNSGNVVFMAKEADAARHAARIRSAVSSRLGVEAQVIVVAGGVFAAILAGNPLAVAGRDPSRLLVAFTQDPGTLADLGAEARGAPEQFALGPHAAYLWCEEGVLASKALEALNRRLGDRTTTRNWATAEKLGLLLASLAG